MPHRIPRRAARSASVRTNGLQREDMVHAERFQHLRFLQHTKRGSTKRLTGRPPRRDRSFGRVRVGRTRHLLCCHDFRTGRWNAGLLEDCRFRLVLSGTRQKFELRTEGYPQRSHRRFRARDGADPTAVRSGHEQTAVADGHHHGRRCGRSGANCDARADAPLFSRPRCNVVAALVTGPA